VTDQGEENTARILQDLEDELREDLERFRAMAERNKGWRERRRAREMREREQQKRRAVVLRAGGRSGVRIAARIGISLRTLRRWTREDETFSSVYDSAFSLWRDGQDQALRLLLTGYHPEKQERERVAS